ncbi:MAG: universal stress protein, partial [Gammaproteobacteria bacterium]
MHAQTLTKTEKQEYEEARLPSYQSILLATDSSDHANRGLNEAIMLARQFGANITATHVYAAKMHDLRFRQMEGGLPEQFRQEHELERQRDVHDDLITRGLSIISDSYLDQVAHACNESAIQFTRCVLEGKNYRALVTETNSSHYDLLIMGALGLGAVAGSRLGSVCQRLVRRTDIDTLVIKEPSRSIAEGPIVVAVDGSAKSYGGLLTALSFTRHWGVALKVVAAFDPYFHYVAFNRIADVLSEEAGKVFKFKDQEKLHEEIIDDGLAKIYQGHLEVAETIARDHGLGVETELLAGKPHDAIAKYLRKTKPSLLVLGKVGIHADPDLDIGGNTENLLIDADCAVLLSQRTYQPRVDVVTDVTTSWTTEAEQRMTKVPSFVQNMARMAILRYAQERGHTVITERIVEEATAQLMPGHAEKTMGEIVTAYDAGEIGTLRDRNPEIGEAMIWSDAAKVLLDTVEDAAVRKNLRMRAEKKARTEGASRVTEQHIQSFLNGAAKGQDSNNQLSVIESEPVYWQAAALARLMRVPEGFMRDKSKQRIEDYA